MIDKKNILGVGITNATQKDILEYIIKNIENSNKKLFVVTPNPEILVLANKNPEFKKVLNRADLASADGIGVLLAAKILGRTLKERFAGVDLVESLCKEVVKKPITVGFLGGRDNVAERTAECLGTKYASLKIVFAAPEWPSELKVENGKLKIENDTKKNSQLLPPCPSEPWRSGANSQLYIDILFVAYGAPKQEMWISENLDKIPVKVAIGVGGSFDYISGNIQRAPLFIRSIGFEWLFRLLIQPWRIKRQLALLEFAFLVLREKLALKNRI